MSEESEVSGKLSVASVLSVAISIHPPGEDTMEKLEKGGKGKMKTREKLGMTILIIIFVSGHVYGQIKAAGQLLIPSADGEKRYKAVIRITRATIEIECSEKIFRLFNAFNTPRYRKLRFNTTEVSEICVTEGRIFILPNDEFYRSYRNLFYPAWRIVSYLYFIIEEKMALIFIMDNPADIGTAAKELLEFINNQGQTGVMSRVK